MEPKTRKRPRGRPKSLFKEPQLGTVQALDRGIALLEVLSHNADLSLSDLAQRVDIPSSTTHRLLATLQKRGFVRFDETAQTWSIGIEAFRVGSTYLGQTDLVEAARKTMRNLTERSGETANLAIAESGDVVFISQVVTQKPIRAFFQPGTRSHMHASGIGKALLADMKVADVEKIVRNKGLPEFTPNTITSMDQLLIDLEATRRRGWSYDDEERYIGMRCIAASICNEHGEFIAGISISGPTARFLDAQIEDLGPMVRNAADELTQAMGGKILQGK
jgi:IclR family acetate operon transcriptional repressor